MKKGITRLQAIAIGQLLLIGVETILGVMAVVSLSNEGGSGINYSISRMMLFVFSIPAIMIFISARTLALPQNRTTDQARKFAFRTQKGLFIVCCLLVIPAVLLAIQGFVPFAVNCVLGIVLWPIVNKDSKSVKVQG
jgi:heme A synthase